jgi:RNA 2',3'-cyclic 3'-phosphodiesterase
MSETTRTFVAIAMPEPLGVELGRLQKVLRSDVPGCRWTSSLPFHATLVFLGDVRRGELDPICEAIASTARRFEPFELRLEGLGAFPSATNPRVIWAGLTAPDLEPLFNLRAGIVKSLAQIGTHCVDPRFHPHVTLGRIKSERRGSLDLSCLLDPNSRWSGGRFTVLEVVTFASTLGPGESSYKPLGRAPLLCKKTVETP